VQSAPVSSTSLSVGLMYAERLARYWWAAQVAGGKEVLDAGCGAGQGARILADAGARRVTGVVVSQNAQAEAVRQAGDVADFVTGKFEALPFAPASFDIVVCFDLIDRSERRSELLDELRRVLREDGSLFLATSTPDELQRELADRFATLARHRQHTRLACAIFADGGEAPPAVRQLPPLEPRQAPVTLLVAGKREAPTLGDLVVLADPFEARSWEDRVERSRRETDLALRRVEEARERERCVAAERDLICRRLMEVEQDRGRSLSREEQEDRPGEEETSRWEATILALGRSAPQGMNALRSAARTLLGLRR